MGRHPRSPKQAQEWGWHVGEARGRKKSNGRGVHSEAWDGLVLQKSLKTRRNSMGAGYLSKLFAQRWPRNNSAVECVNTGSGVLGCSEWGWWNFNNSSRNAELGAPWASPVNASGGQVGHQGRVFGEQIYVGREDACKCRRKLPGLEAGLSDCQMPTWDALSYLHFR